MTQITDTNLRCFILKSFIYYIVIVIFMPRQGSLAD